MELDRLSIVQRAPTENQINDVLNYVQNKMENLFIDDWNKERDEALLQAERQGIDPPEEKDIPDRINMTIDRTNEILFEFSSLPYFWKVEDPTQITFGLDKVQ